MPYLDPPDGAFSATTNGIVSCFGAMFLPASRVPSGQTQPPEIVQNRSAWKAMSLLPPLSWTLASPSVLTVTTSPDVALTFSTVFDRPGPVEPDAAGLAGRTPPKSTSTRPRP